MITLYDCATAPSPRRARILLAEKGVAHATVQVDLRTGEQLGEAYRRINPHCTVPALQADDGLLLTDNAAIAAWLEARFPEPALLGVTPQEKAEVASWNWHIEFEGLQAIAEALRNGSPAMANRAPRAYMRSSPAPARPGTCSPSRSSICSRCSRPCWRNMAGKPWSTEPGVPGGGPPPRVRRPSWSRQCPTPARPNAR